MNAREHIESAEELAASAEKLISESVERDPADPVTMHGLRLAELGIHLAQVHATLALVRVQDAAARSGEYQSLVAQEIARGNQC